MAVSHGTPHGKVMTADPLQVKGVWVPKCLQPQVPFVHTTEAPSSFLIV